VANALTTVRDWRTQEPHRHGLRRHIFAIDIAANRILAHASAYFQINDNVTDVWAAIIAPRVRKRTTKFDTVRRGRSTSHIHVLEQKTVLPNAACKSHTGTTMDRSTIVKDRTKFLCRHVERVDALVVAMDCRHLHRATPRTPPRNEHFDAALSRLTALF
jgi:hypothetical protein